MKRLKIWNHGFTVFVFLLPAGVVYLMSEGSKSFTYWPKLHYPSAIASLALAGFVWSIYLNHVFLPGMARGRVYGKSAALLLFEAYLSSALLVVVHYLWLYPNTPGTEVFKTALILPGVVQVWIFPLTLPLFLFCVFLNGFMLKRLYK